MSDIKDWSSVDDNNNQGTPDGWPEGQAPSTVNNCARADKGGVRRWYLEAEWSNPGGSPTYVSTSQFTIADDSEVTDYSQYYTEGRMIKLEGTTPFTAYGRITSVVYSSPTTTVNFDADPGYDAIDANLSNVSFGINKKYNNSFPSIFPTNYKYDFLVDNNVGDLQHDVDVFSGGVKDELDFIDMINPSTLVKQIDANWAEGTNQGGFPSGISLSPSTTYNFFAIAKTDGTVDAGWDSSATAANLLADATDYSYYRKLAEVTVNGSSNISGIANEDALASVSEFEIFTSSGTWNKPDGISWVEVFVIGAGGGGGGSQSDASAVQDGSTGGTSSFGAHVSCTGGTGGEGGNIAPAGGNNGVGGTSTGGDLNNTGGAGVQTATANGGDGGETNNGEIDSTGGVGGVGNVNGAAGTDYGSGGGGAGNVAPRGGGGGGSGAYGKKMILAGSVNASETITIGTGGAGGNGNNKDGGAGADGVIIVKSF